MSLDGPRWELEIAPGQFLSPALKSMIGRVTVEATVDGADELQVEARSWDEVRARYLWQPGEPLGSGSAVVVWGGYGRSFAPLQRFVIPRRGTREDAGGASKKQIVGYSAEASLVAWEGSRVFGTDTTDGQIAAAIARDHGFYTDATTVDDTPARSHARVKKKGTSDWDFLRGLAFSNGLGSPWVRWDPVRGANVLYWRKTRLEDQAEMITFRLRRTDGLPSTLLKFSMDYSTADVPTAVEVSGWDPVRGEPMRVVVTIDSPGQSPGLYTGRPAGPVSAAIKSGTQLQIANLSASGELIKDQREVVGLEGGAPRTEAELKAWAERWLETRNRAFVQGDAVTVGYELGWIGQLHRFEGVDPEFAGLYEAGKVTHTWEGGVYRTKWDLARVLEEQGPTKESI